ncbi:type V toxin-antitoxin system endoribonuclease antitoxin GhoS [Klebsiella pneumoniae]|uniref:type V toxin-antitoxin system endoribonuclease antitoxin GhoS n=1 Tax=Klebsiella pneumoniae TaxID=573 RepID=UPI001CF498E4|nr:type V toxin-antitoxin system endoribonuclease antitoxin GhoS [Klebsiella pneumoniae]MCA6701580.1 type V toxin-antitoxin system endoribonuclease antitoxin GhoS [Klebsiella pneumoniae]HDY6675888.1 type V toxin-antitoxin system endoribonuclease antitoxin GhoS [Escherichia coli]
MADYVVRVEIFDASGEDYENLHEAMASYGFKKTIVGDSGKERQLPTGTYVGNKSEAAHEVRDKIKDISNPFSSKTPAIFVCRFDIWSAYLYS